MTIPGIIRLSNKNGAFCRPVSRRIYLPVVAEHGRQLILKEPNHGKLTGKVAIVTGASKGIGAAIALAYAKEGATVVVNYASSKAGADKVVAEITKGGGKSMAVQGDMSKTEDI
jgi:3-oxoacyl-ACP reductase-like protein